MFLQPDTKFFPVSPTYNYDLSQLAHGTLYTHSEVCSISSLSFGRSKMFLRVLYGFTAHGTLCFLMILAAASEVLFSLHVESPLMIGIETGLAFSVSSASFVP